MLYLFSGTHTDEVFARGYKIISDFLDKAREKYFFADDSTPSFRISEDVDECGNIIKEHELWRPVWMKDECYNKKIEASFSISFFHPQVVSPVNINAIFSMHITFFLFLINRQRS